MTDHEIMTSRNDGTSLHRHFLKQEGLKTCVQCRRRSTWFYFTLETPFATIRLGEFCTVLCCERYERRMGW